MTTILSNRLSKFGMTCVQCRSDLLPPNGPSIGMSGKSVIFGTAGNATLLRVFVSFPAVTNGMKDIKTVDYIYPSLLVA